MNTNTTPRDCRSHQPGALAARAAIAALALLGGCSAGSHPAPPAPLPEVSVVRVHPARVPLDVELPGRTTPFATAQVRARVDGIIEQRVLTDGADVRKGQLLYRVDRAPFQAALDGANAALQKAQANLAATSAQRDRYRQLVDSDGVSRQAYDNAVAASGQAAADVASARAAVASAAINLAYTTITAPLSGRAGISQVNQGAYVQGASATLLTTIDQIDPIYVDLRQSSVEALALREAIDSGSAASVAGLDGTGAAGLQVGLKLEDGSAYPVPGVLQFSGATVDPATGTVVLRARFPNPRHVLLPGMFVRATLAQGIAQQAITVPLAALSHNAEGKSTVLVVGEDSKVASRVVQTSGMTGQRWIIAAGLADNERVIVDGGLKVRPGMQVKTVAMADPAPPEKLASAGGH